MSDATQQYHPTPPLLRVAYRSAGQFLVSYCANLSRGAVFVRSQQPLPVDTEVNLALDVPDNPVPTVVAARVKWVRHQPSKFGPPGMGLVFEHIEDLLGEAIDRLVATADPLLIDVIGCSSVLGNHLTSLLQSLIRCDVEHLDYGPQLELSCEQADLMLIDLRRDTQAALDLVDILARSPGTPPALVLAPPMHDTVRDQAAKSARIVESPIDRSELQRALLESLAQVSWFEINAVPASPSQSDAYALGKAS